jgi:hypothetical protein
MFVVPGVTTVIAGLGPLARRDGFDVIVVAAVCAVIHVAKLG